MDFDVGEVLADAWQMVRDHWLIAAIIVALTGGIITAIDLSFEESTAVRLQCFFGLVTLYLELLFLVRLLRDRRVLFDKPHEDGSPTLGKFLPAVGQGILWTIGVGIGLVLLVLPGVVLAALWYVCLPVMLSEDRGVFESLARSFALVKPHLWRVVGVVLLLGVTYAGILAVAILAFPFPYFYSTEPVSLIFYLVANLATQAVLVGGWALCVATYLHLQSEPVRADLENVFA